MAGKIPRWESELWAYISSGDGEHCPLSDHCEVRRNGDPCLDDNRGDFDTIRKLLDSGQLSKRVINYPDYWNPGRIFNLIEMLAQECLEKGNVIRPPVPMALVSLFDKTHAIEVHPLPLKSYHGAIWRLKDRWVIQLRDKDTLARRRYTLFHEAFHILAHREAVPVFKKRDSQEGSFNELLADYFAFCILMPKKWVREEWVEVKDLNRLAKLFDVPQKLMRARLKLLGLI